MMSTSKYGQRKQQHQMRNLEKNPCREDLLNFLRMFLISWKTLSPSKVSSIREKKTISGKRLTQSRHSYTTRLCWEVSWRTNLEKKNSLNEVSPALLCRRLSHATLVMKLSRKAGTKALRLCFPRRKWRHRITLSFWSSPLFSCFAIDVKDTETFERSKLKQQSAWTTVKTNERQPPHPFFTEGW